MTAKEREERQEAMEEETKKEEGKREEELREETEERRETVEVPLDEMEDLRKKAQERDEFYDLLLRARADLENMVKRMEREKERWKELILRDLVEKLLPALDALHAAASHPEESERTSLIEGIRMMDRQIIDCLRKSGVSTMEPEPGENFDPALHEALISEPSQEFEAGTIIEVLRRGFRTENTVIRPAQVKVSAGTQKQEEEAAGEESPSSDRQERSSTQKD